MLLSFLWMNSMASSGPELWERLWWVSLFSSVIESLNVDSDRGIYYSCPVWGTSCSLCILRALWNEHTTLVVCIDIDPYQMCCVWVRFLLVIPHFTFDFEDGLIFFFQWDCLKKMLWLSDWFSECFLAHIDRDVLWTYLPVEAWDSNQNTLTVTRLYCLIWSNGCFICCLIKATYFECYWWSLKVYVHFKVCTPGAQVVGVVSVLEFCHSVFYLNSSRFC